ncbi:MAG TPA: uracil-DNA glycosylase [Candidatus Dormibacteraeota bacterium]|nr:uracil-DNA glycosylase [Candidatus Dormibacteraeota bacterium]
MAGDSQWAELDAVGAAARACVRCPLAATRTQVVFGTGRADANLVVVGEAPGQAEDRAGRPFVGSAGRQLRALLADAGLNVAVAYLTNVVLCHPPGAGGRADRTPVRAEIDACRAWLEAQLNVVRPRLILAVGVTAAQRLLDSSATLGSLRGRAHETAHGPVIATYHPSAFNRVPGRRTAFMEDVQRAIATLQAER